MGDSLKQNRTFGCQRLFKKRKITQNKNNPVRRVCRSSLCLRAPFHPCGFNKKRILELTLRPSALELSVYNRQCLGSEVSHHPRIMTGHCCDLKINYCKIKRVTPAWFFNVNTLFVRSPNKWKIDTVAVCLLGPRIYSKWFFFCD